MNEDAIRMLFAMGQANAMDMSLPEGMYVVPKDTTIVDQRQQTAARPGRPRGNVQLHTVRSFIEYLGRWLPAKTDDEDRLAPEAIVWANPESHNLIAVLNENGPIDSNIGPGWRDWIATFSAVYSSEFQVWNGFNGRRMKQTEFAQFLEDNLPDIVEPSGAQMLQIARTFETKENVDFSSSVRMDNGDVQLNYQGKTEATAGKGSIKVPDRFTIAVSIFDGEPRDKIECRLRYRISGASLTIWYDMHRAERAVEQAFSGICEQVTDQLAVPLLRGDPRV